MGDGGLIVTNNDLFADKIRVLKNHGANPKYYHNLIGINSRLDTIQATILMSKLPYVKDWLAKRKNNAEFYLTNITNDNLILPELEAKAGGSFNQFSIKSKRREAIIGELTKNKIGTAIYYPKPMHLQECFTFLNYKENDFPVSEKIANEVFSIPIYPGLTKENLSYITETLNKL